MYRLYTEVKVSMGFMIPSDEVARLINAMKTVLRYLTDLYHDHSNNVMHIHAIKRLCSNIIFISNDSPWKYFYSSKKISTSAKKIVNLSDNDQRLI